MENGSRSDIAYITHQCTRFSTCPKKYHSEEILWLDRYLKGTKDKGTILLTVKERGLEVYVDAYLQVIGMQRNTQILTQ